MSRHKKNAVEVAEEIILSLRSGGLVTDKAPVDQSLVDNLSRILVGAGFPERDVLTKDITILLSDIRGFSEIAGAHDANDVVQLLNRYFDGMGEIITKYGGSIDKLMGDSILVVFGIPDPHPQDVENALACAVEMQQAMSGINAHNESIGMPALYMGIAINSGKVVAGDLGSRHYNEYTVIGDEVNLTSRIESHCLRGQILISGNTYERAKDYIEVGEPNSIEVKGARKAVNLYELLATNRPEPMEVPRREGRKSPRIQVSMPVVFQRMSGKIVLDEKYEGDVIDISYNGLLIETDQSLPKSSEIKMLLSLDLFGGRNTDVYARIINTEPFGDKFRSNMEFTIIEDEGSKTIKQHVDRLVGVP